MGEKMKKNWKLLTVLSVSLVLGACAGKVLCFAQKRFVVAAASQAAVAGKCKKPSAIEKDFNEVLSKVTKCETMQTGPIADLVCPTLSGFVAGFASSKIPASWECDPSASADVIAKAIEAGCKLIPVDNAEFQ